MATASFTKEFSITKQSTIDRLEKAIENIQPMTVTEQDVVAKIQRSDSKLLNMLRSKA